MTIRLAAIVTRSRFRAGGPHPGAGGPQSRAGRRLSRDDTSIAVPPIPDAPFSATVETEWTRYLDSGARMVLRNRRLVARDSLGHVFQERRTFVPDGSRVPSQVWRTELAEPQTPWPCGCCSLPCLPGVALYVAAVWQARRVCGPFAEGNDSLVREDARRWIGLDLIGTRETQTLGLTATGSDRPLAIVKEFWYSKPLGLNVITRRTDPRRARRSSR